MVRIGWWSSHPFVMRILFLHPAWLSRVWLRLHGSVVTALGLSGKGHDLVILLAQSEWGQEIRYALRSYEMYCPWIRQVWIVGYLPPYLDPDQIIHIPEEAVTPRGVFVESEVRRLVNELPGLADDYVLGSDDCYLLRPVTPVDLGPLWLQDLSSVADRGSNPWQLMLWRTHDLLVHMGYPAHNYEAHTPTTVNRALYREMARRFVNTELVAHHRYHGICSISAYWNMLECRPSRRPADDVRVGLLTTEDAATEDLIAGKTEGMTFLYHNDAGLTPALKAFLAAWFDRPSRFERPEGNPPAR